MKNKLNERPNVKILKREEIKGATRNPTYTLERVEIWNKGKTPQIYYDFYGDKIHIEPNQKASFVRAKPKPFKKLNVYRPTVEYRVEE